MNSTTICVSFIVSMLGVSYPILTQVVARLDDKYSSTIIVDLFNKENDRKFFLASLILALIFLLLCILNFPPATSNSELNIILENSASELLVFIVTFLVIFFFRFVNKVLVYYVPFKFLRYLINNHNEDKKNNIIYFKAISDVFYFSIRQQNSTIAKTISDFMYGAFKLKREENTEIETQYPSAYYEVTYNATEELCILKNNKLKYLEVRTVGGIWLLGEMKYNKISENTYLWLWRNLQLAISFEKDAMVISYWEQADQYIKYSLQQIAPEYRARSTEIINTESILLRNQERERFLEFNFVLGGLLLYKERYNCLGRIFKYTTSHPPTYDLLPASLDDIFKLYLQFRDPYEVKYTWISSKYPFPEFDGLNADWAIKKWVCKYLALLFLRQYSIIPYLTTMTPLDLPKIPQFQNEKKQWIDNMDFFKMLIEEVYHNENLKSAVGLSFLNNDWCETNKKLNPLEIIDKVKSNLLESYENTEMNQEIVESKERQFYESSKMLLSELMNEYIPITNKNSIINNFNSWTFVGGRTILDKSAFAENQDSHHVNFDLVLASSIAKRFRSAISETFFHNKSSNYVLSPEDIFTAIDQLNLNEEYVIVCFSLDLSYFIDTLKIPELTPSKYKNIEIISFWDCNYFLVGESIFILKKSDLPNLINNRVTFEEIEKYSLKMIDEKFNIYSSIIDLNKNSTLRQELIGSGQERDMKKSVLLTLAINIEIRWKKKVDNLFIRMYSQFEERGLPNSLSDFKKG